MILLVVMETLGETQSLNVFKDNLDLSSIFSIVQTTKFVDIYQ